MLLEHERNSHRTSGKPPAYPPRRVCTTAEYEPCTDYYRVDTPVCWIMDLSAAGVVHTLFPAPAFEPHCAHVLLRLAAPVTNSPSNVLPCLYYPILESQQSQLTEHPAIKHEHLLLSLAHSSPRTQLRVKQRVN